MWSWQWSPLTQTSLLLSPSDGLASFLKTTLANGVKVVKKVITSNFRFHLIAIYALGCFRNFSCTPVPKLPWRVPPNPHETSERMNFNVIDKIQLTWKLFIYWYLMPFFHKKNVRKFLGHHYAIWASDSNFLLALISGTEYMKNHLFEINTIWNIKNCICGVMVRLLVLDVLDHGSCSSQIKDYQIDICCFSAKHTALRRKSNDWLSRNQDNVERRVYPLTVVSVS